VPSWHVHNFICEHIYNIPKLICKAINEYIDSNEKHDICRNINDGWWNSRECYEPLQHVYNTWGDEGVKAFVLHHIVDYIAKVMKNVKNGNNKAVRTWIHMICYDPRFTALCNDHYILTEVSKFAFQLSYIRANQALNSFSQKLREHTPDINLHVDSIDSLDKVIQGLIGRLYDVVYEILWLIWWDRSLCPICKLRINNTRDVVKVPEEYGHNAYKVHRRCLYELKYRASNFTSHSWGDKHFTALAYQERVPPSIAFAAFTQVKTLDYYLKKR
jgi:hypothetical protein